MEKELHIYTRKMIWLRNGKLKSWNYKSIIWVFRFSGILGKSKKNKNIVVKYFVGYFKFISCLCLTFPS